jgi:hypothetical protein
MIPLRAGTLAEPYAVVGLVFTFVRSALVARVSIRRRQ